MRARDATLYMRAGSAAGAMRYSPYMCVHDATVLHVRAHDVMQL